MAEKPRKGDVGRVTPSTWKQSAQSSPMHVSVYYTTVAEQRDLQARYWIFTCGERRESGPILELSKDRIYIQEFFLHVGDFYLGRNVRPTELGL